MYVLRRAGQWPQALTFLHNVLHLFSCTNGDAAATLITDEVVHLMHLISKKSSTQDGILQLSLIQCAQSVHDDITLVQNANPTHDRRC